MTNRTVQVFQDRVTLVAAIADRFVEAMIETLQQRDTANVVLTGGSVGIEVLAAIGSAGRGARLDWERIHVWWGDERWLAPDDAERNDVQATDALLSGIACPADNVHRFPADDGSMSLDDAALAYSRELAACAPQGSAFPHLDLVFLGVGPDGHVASLFPGREGVTVKDEGVIAVRNSPKPPPERLSLTLPLINSADRVWLCLAGQDKASALGLALAGASAREVPAAGVSARQATEFFVDQAAAAEVPQELLTNSEG